MIHRSLPVIVDDSHQYAIHPITEKNSNNNEKIEILIWEDGERTLEVYRQEIRSLQLSNTDSFQGSHFQ